MKVICAAVLLGWIAVWLHQIRTEYIALFRLGLGGYSEGWPPVIDRLDGHIVSLRLMEVTNDDLVDLRRFTKLHTLNLSGSRRIRVESRRGKEELRLVPVTKNSVTDSGLVHLERLKNLDGLLLRDTGVTDTGLVHLKSLVKLRVLNLDGCDIRGEGLRHLKDLNCLRSLSLKRSEITDRGLAYLPRIPHLAELWLNNTQVSDSGIVHFQRMKTLELVGLSNTMVTEEGVNKLRQALKNCDVIHETENARKTQSE